MNETPTAPLGLCRGFNAQELTPDNPYRRQVEIFVMQLQEGSVSSMLAAMRGLKTLARVSEPVARSLRGLFRHAADDMDLPEPIREVAQTGLQYCEPAP